MIVPVLLLNVEVNSPKELLDDWQDEDFFGEGNLNPIGLLQGLSWAINIVEVGLVEHIQCFLVFFHQNFQSLFFTTDSLLDCLGGFSGFDRLRN